MLGNSTEKMVLISSTTNQWSQNEPQGLNMASIGNTVMEKSTQQQISQEALKCPRCDSSSTKFCYYNNYSLSQPRHFCKACKRYWTRGGTLRNVPVGGGCRRKKKMKRSISAVDQSLSSSSSPTASSNPNITQAMVNPVLFGFPTNPNLSSEMGTLQYSSFNPRISSLDTVLGFDRQAQMSSFGFGFANNNGNYHNGSANSLLSSYPFLGSSTNSPTTIASLLGPNLNQQKFNNINNGFQELGSFEDVQMGGNMNSKVKREEGQNCQNPNFQSHLEQISSSDPTLYWNATSIGAWHDPTNLEWKNYQEGGFMLWISQEVFGSELSCQLHISSLKFFSKAYKVEMRLKLR